MKHIESICVHGGERGVDRQNRSVVIPVEQSVAYYFSNTDQVIKFHQGKLGGVKYGRYGCPTQHAVEEKIAQLEKTDRSLIFSSGMSALTTTILALVQAGQHLVFTDDCYRNTKNFILNILSKLGIESTEIPIDKINLLEKYIRNNTVLFFTEIPTNPFLRVIDLGLLNILKDKKIITLIDSTLATPINLQPAKYGVDLVVHSATKYLGGHHDLFAGVVAGENNLIQKIQDYRDIFGGIINPQTSSLLLRSLQTLAVRMKVYNDNALKIAKFLDNHSKVSRVWYPGLATHPDFAIAKKQMVGFGGVITFTLKATLKNTSKFIDSLSIPYIATNFGGPQSLIEQYYILTFFKHKQEARKRKIKYNLIRYSVGLENADEVIKDFSKALDEM